MKEKFIMCRDLPVRSRKENTTIEKIVTKEFNITRDTYNRYKKQVNDKLILGGKKTTHLKDMSDSDIEIFLNSFEPKEKEINITDEINKTKEPELLKEVINDLNEKTPEPQPEPKKVDIVEEQKIIENQEKFYQKSVFKWGLIIGGGLLLLTTILITRNKKKTSSKPKNNLKTNSNVKNISVHDKVSNQHQTQPKEIINWF